MLVSVIIPIAPAHGHVAARAIASVTAQTLPCDLITIEDTHKRGAAWARNQGLQKTQTPFTVFLDADDELQPEFVERTIGAWCEHGGGARYVYTDWKLSDGTTRYGRDGFNIFREDMVHIITTLLPTTAALLVGGFDETMPTGEDVDLYHKLHVLGLCAHRLPQALVNYHINDGHSATNRVTNTEAAYTKAVAQLDALIEARYGKYRSMNMACGGNCGDSTPQGRAVIGQQQEGDILAEALYTPMRVTGSKSGRGYPRAGLGSQLWVDPRDLQARPDLWRAVVSLPNIAPDVDTVMQLAKEAMIAAAF